MSDEGSRRISRRQFIHTSAGAMAFLGAAQIDTRRQRVRGACMHDCPDTCSWVVTTENGRAVGLEGDPDHPLTRGALCEKMDGFLTDVVYNPDRVLYPLRRTGEKGEAKFERVSWDEALDAISTQLKRVIGEDGPEAILPYSYAGTEGLVQCKGLDRRFFARLGATRLERSICGATANAGLTATMGTSTGILPEDIQKSRFIIVWASNPVVTNPHGWPHIEEARRRGARLVVIDPLRTPTAEKADWHLRPRPGTDAALALGMMHVIVGEGLDDREYIERYTIGFERLRERLRDYPPERIAEITGLKVEDVVELAKAYATTRPSTIRTQIALEKHSNGAMMYRAIACLPALVGAWRDEGGGMLQFTADWYYQALDLASVSMPELEDPKTRSVNMVQLGMALTDEAMAPPIRALIVYNSNPATIAQNQNLVAQGLKRTDLMTVVMDHFVTDTARYADYVLPAATQAEYLDLLAPWGSPYLTLNLPALEPPGEALANSEIFRRLARKMGLEEAYLYDSDEDIIRKALASGHPYLKGITYETLQRDGWAHLDLPRPYLPYAEGGFPTASGKCELYAAGLEAAGLDPLPRYDAPAGDLGSYPLTFMSVKSNHFFLNSSHANQPRHLQASGEPRLRIHPGDASKRGIENAQRVRVYNDRGSIEIEALVDDGTLEGVVTMPHGYWASLLPGGASANALTPDGLADLGGGGSFYDAKVEVERVG